MDTTYFRSFDQLRTNELSVIRDGWFRPDYELTDGQFTYGKLTYTGWFRRIAILETAGSSWTITRKGGFSRTLLINNSGNETIGEITFETWSRKIKIAMKNGFEVIFTTKKVFSRTFTLISERYGDLFNIEQKLWAMKKPLLVIFDSAQLVSVPDASMLMLISVYLVLLRQQQAAAAAQ